MMTAQEQQVCQRSLASVGPVLDVMRVGEAQAAAREAAAPIADLERPADGRRNGAGLPAYIQHGAVAGAADLDHRRVARQPAGRFI